MILINLWMILMLDKHHPKVDDSCHQFMDVSCAGYISSGTGCFLAVT